MLKLTAAGSPVVISPGAIDELGALVAGATSAHRAAIVTDANVGHLYASRAQAALSALSPVLITVPAGEAHKTRETWAYVTDEMLAHGLARDGVVIALGGGVVGDLAGFAAATYMRGIPVVQVPTSLVAMIDASIGGKTGVDVPAGKNLVGAFHAPALIAVDPKCLATLPARELRCGIAEAIKHGAVADAEYFERIATAAPTLRDPGAAGTPAMRDLVERSVAIKAEVVNEDPREAGRRKILNFGHTLGHAIESASDYALHHGEGIAIGMVLEAKLGERLGVTAAGTAARIERALTSAGLPTTTSIAAADLLPRTRADKKARSGRVEYSLPTSIGTFGAWTTVVADSDVTATLAAQ